MVSLPFGATPANLRWSVRIEDLIDDYYDRSGVRTAEAPGANPRRFRSSLPIQERLSSSSRSDGLAP